MPLFAILAACGAETPGGESALPVGPVTPAPPVAGSTPGVAGSAPFAGTPGGPSIPAGASGTGVVAGAAPGQAGAGGSAVPPLPTGTAGGFAAGSGGAAPLPAAGSGGLPQAGSGAENPLDADIETCYELRAHGQPSPSDKTKYAVPSGENYTGFIMKTPWTTPVQGLRFRHLPDNKAVLHHWLLYEEAAPFADGDIDQCALDGPTGFLCGQATTRTLITGWAPGRGDFRMPEGVGLELPGPGKMLAVEFHYFNSGAPTQDQSGVEVCVTSKFRPNTASITWLGTHRINLAPGVQGTASGTCNPLRTGMAADEPIHVLFSWPHMHKLGTHLKSVVNRAAGGQDIMYDGAFNFDLQAVHETPVKLMPGDSVTTTCTFQNTTSAPVGFGQSTEQEMCYNFTYAWPAHALDNPGAEIGGATNTCLH